MNSKDIDNISYLGRKEHRLDVMDSYRELTRKYAWDRVFGASMSCFMHVLAHNVFFHTIERSYRAVQWLHGTVETERNP